MEAAAFLAETGRARTDLFRMRLGRAAADPASEEAIHDLRVSIRRVLAWIAVREALLGPNRDLRAARSSLKALMSPLGKLRDAHVKRDLIRTILPKGDEPSYLYAVLVASDVRRWEERVRRLLGRKSARRIRVPLPMARIGRETGADASVAGLRHLSMLGRAVRKHRKDALDPSNPVALHRMRLSFKKYRYAWELLEPLLPRAARNGAKRLHDFQTLLGTIHDCDVILAGVRTFRDGCLGEKAECALETAVRSLRSEKFRDFLRIAAPMVG
ncbi:MAG: CHAD domain-containing protein [Deltaproteobacteria bacterium]|uniref:CHAD domain-containing protein n=1 Tax=Candidatus Deferrimicrobium sp. TaxID=3060586 RepID=UPI002727B89B|nr:CHAD domain-containing protein [Candidatus Deferrimicrobium sp.]MCR4309675.1 CHAD domain-containing protein [Deltaproteobacteria bacterium]MDO8738302.1 CHAD domain-containing protein [Candidatus Deferrimicrobium sp.]